MRVSLNNVLKRLRGASWSLAALACLAGQGALAQSPRYAEYAGSRWGFFQYETGAANRTVITGVPQMHEGPTDRVITIVSRDGQALGERDRARASELAEWLCERGSWRFNSRSRGNWLRDGGLGFHGACTRW